jgi:hypothetical protein
MEKYSSRTINEGTKKYSLFAWKKYQIKYETIRRTKLYQKLKSAILEK